MIQFLKRLKETVEKYPDRVAVVDKDGARSTSYRQLFEQAAKVNRWMREHDIGAETVVAISCLLYQGDLYQHIPNELAVSAEMMDRGEFACNNALNVEIIDNTDDFGVMLNYNAALYAEDSMERFTELICCKCAEIIAAVEG